MSQLTGRLFITKEEAGIVWTSEQMEQFILQSNELVWTMVSKAQHKILLPILCLEKIEKPPFMFGFALVWVIVPCDLENSPLLFPAKAVRLWSMIIFDTSEKNIWTKGVNPLWTKALFIIFFPWSLCNPAPKPKASSTRHTPGKSTGDVPCEPWMSFR